MSFRLAYQGSRPASESPFRLLNGEGQEVALVNEFLDAQILRGLSERSLRAYGFALLPFAEWWFQGQPKDISQLDEAALLDYIRYQLNHEPKPTPQTVNHRLTVVRCLYRFHCGEDIPTPRTGRNWRTRSPLGYGRPRRVPSGLRLRQSRRLIVPLCSDEIAEFWGGFHTFRDLALIALMLFNGMRSREILAIQLEDLNLSQAQIRVHGKGNKDRILPLLAETMQVLNSYLQLERPLTNSSYLFVSLKGRSRGCPMTPAGLRSLFRHHRRKSRVFNANPHRFRHTFGSDMVRAGISLPALMQLMGHAHIQTTMLYVQLSPHDVRMEYAKAVAARASHCLPKML